MKNLQLINTFHKAFGYKNNSHKSVAILYAKDKWTQKEMTETTHFKIAMNDI